MRLKSALRRGVAAAVIAGIVVSSGIPAYAGTWNIADGDITVKGASDGSGNYNEVKQGDKDFEKDEGETVITGESKENTVTIDTSGGKVSATGGAADEKLDGSRTGAAGIGDGAGMEKGEVYLDAPPSNPNHIYISGDAEVEAKAGASTGGKTAAIGGGYGEVPTDALSDAEHKVTGGRLTRLNADGTEMEGMGYDYTSTPTPQPDDDDDDDDENDAPPPAQENAPEPLPGGMVVNSFFSSRVTIQRLDPALAIESANPMPGGVEAADTGEVLAPGGVVLIESAAPRSTITTDIPSLREDGVEDIFFRYEDTLTYYSVDKMAAAAGEDADVELKQNREDISLRLDGETWDDLSERYQEWVPVLTPEVKERLILTHKEVEQKTSEELRRELDESLKQLAARFEDIAPEEDKKPLLFLVDPPPPPPPHTERKKYTNPLESVLRSYADLGDDWEDLPDRQGEIKPWLPEDLEKAKLWIPEDLGHLISPSKESLSGSDGIA